MANDQKSSEQDKQKLPSREEQGGAKQRDKGATADPQPGSDAPLDPEDAAFIKKNK